MLFFFEKYRKFANEKSVSIQKYSQNVKQKLFFFMKTKTIIQRYPYADSELHVLKSNGWKVKYSRFLPPDFFDLSLFLERPLMTLKQVRLFKFGKRLKIKSYVL